MRCRAARNSSKIAWLASGLWPAWRSGSGVGVGAIAGILQPQSARLPAVVAAGLTGLVAMSISDATMAALAVSDPRTWTPGSVAADAIPHLANGAVTTLAVDLILGPRSVGPRLARNR